MTEHSVKKLYKFNGIVKGSGTAVDVYAIATTLASATVAVKKFAQIDDSVKEYPLGKGW